jgi:flavin-dependent dehydrogenase
VETVEHLILGAGPAGLRAAQVLAEAGREVLVLEKREEIGPKTCAGGLTPKAVRELEWLGLPRDAGLQSVGHVAFAGGAALALDPERAMVRTIPRRELGRLQLRWTRAAGAEVRAGWCATAIDLPARTVVSGGSRIRWRHLIGADGSDSAVRRKLGLRSPRACFAAEYNVPAVRREPLRVECDPGGLASGYFWVFPHTSYTSIGAVAPKHLVPPASVCRYLAARVARLGISLERVPLEGATVEVAFHGFHFANGVHLVGDAAGVASSLTAEGIYSALITGSEVARTILDPSYPAPRAARWLRIKRRHDRLARLLALDPARSAIVSGLAALARCSLARRPMANWFLSG